MGCAASAEVAYNPLDGTQSFFEAYTLGDKLGKGSFAQVRETRHQASSGVFAVKIMSLQDTNKAGLHPEEEPSSISSKMASVFSRNPQVHRTQEEHAREEARVWLQAGEHANVVGLKAAFLQADICFFVMDLCETPLLRHLRCGAGAEFLQEASLGRVLSQALAGVGHIHGRGVLHRDIKPDNFMVQDGTVRLCDFGLSVLLPQNERVFGCCGTAPFCAPEMLLRQPYGKQADVWSLGVMAYVLLFGAYPYNPADKSAKAMREAIAKGQPLPQFRPSKSISSASKVSSKALSFVQRLLNRDPAMRGSAEDALASTYLVDLREGLYDEAELPSLLSQLELAERLYVLEQRELNRSVDKLDPMLFRLASRTLARQKSGLSKTTHSEGSDRNKVQRISTGRSTMSTLTLESSDVASLRTMSNASLPELHEVASTKSTPEQDGSRTWVVMKQSL